MNELRLKVYPRQYHLLGCYGCRKKFEDREQVWQFYVFAPSYVYLCADCMKQKSIIQDFEPLGSKEQSQMSWGWQWIRQVVLERDKHRCRLWSESVDMIGREHWDKTEVHHIIPRKDGGTDNFKNLITLCEVCHRQTFKNGYGGIPRLEQKQLLIDFMPSEGRVAWPTTPKIKVPES